MARALHLALLLSFLATAQALTDPWFGRLASARRLTGEELLRIGEIHDAQNHFVEALTYYEQALESFRAAKQRRDVAVTLTKIGSIFERQGRWGAATGRLREAVTLFLRFPTHPAYGDALFALGRVSAWMGGREEAERLFEQAIVQFTHSHSFGTLDSARIQLGLLYISDDRSQEGLALLQRTLSDAHERHDDSQVLAALLALGDARWIMDEPAIAWQHYNEALLLIEKGRQPSLEAHLQRRIAHFYEVSGQLEEGIRHAKRAVVLYQTLRDSSGEAASWTLLASLHRAMGQDHEGEEAIQHALLIYRRKQLVVHATH